MSKMVLAGAVSASMPVHGAAATAIYASLLNVSWVVSCCYWHLAEVEFALLLCSIILPFFSFFLLLIISVESSVFLGLRVCSYASSTFIYACTIWLVLFHLCYSCFLSLCFECLPTNSTLLFCLFRFESCSPICLCIAASLEGSLVP
jgi:hypothetical protein